MGSSPDVHLFYGYVWDDETSIASLLNDEGDEWVEVLLKRRGVASPWDFYRDSGAEADHASRPYKDQRAAYDYWKSQVGFQAMLDEWSAEKKAAKQEFNCAFDCYGALNNYPGTAYVYVTFPGETYGYRGSWDGPTPIDPASLALWDRDQMNSWLMDFIAALDLNMEGGEWHKPPHGPDWFMVCSYG